MWVATLLLATCVLLKTVAIINATRWLARHGIRYRDAIAALERDHQTPAREKYREAFLKSDPWFFPFGAKDYRLHQWIDQLRAGSWSRRLLSLLLAVFAHGLFSYAALACL